MHNWQSEIAPLAHARNWHRSCTGVPKVIKLVSWLRPLLPLLPAAAIDRNGVAVPLVVAAAAAAASEAIAAGL